MEWPVKKIMTADGTQKKNSIRVKDAFILSIIAAMLLLLRHACVEDAKRIAVSDEARAALYSRTADVVNEVGVDLEPGVYKLEALNEYADYHHARVTEKASGDTLLFIRNIYRKIYIELSEGQVLTTGAGITITPLGEISTSSESCTINFGWNIIGHDCKEGIYKLEGPTDESFYAFHRDFSIDSHEFANREYISNSRSTMVELHNGDIVELNYCFGIFVSNLAEEEPVNKERELTRSITPKPDRSQTIVFITRTGSKYHTSSHCTGLNNANETFSTTLGEAEEMGLTPCKRCH